MAVGHVGIVPFDAEPLKRQHILRERPRATEPGVEVVDSLDGKHNDAVFDTMDLPSRGGLRFLGGLFNEACDSAGLRDVDGMASLRLNDRHHSSPLTTHAPAAAGGRCMAHLAARLNRL